MVPNPQIMEAVEKLGYRVTVGDVAVKAGIDVNFARQGLLALASDTGGHLQVAESGDIAYLFPKNFRDILRNKFWRLQLQEWWAKVWRILFYLIRISFGIILLLSICLIVLGIILGLVVLKAASSSGDNNNDNFDGFSIPNINLDSIFWLFYWDSYRPNYYDYQPSRRSPSNEPNKNELNFLEAIYSFLFGDGNPNYNLEARRWQEIASIIRENQGAIIAEQITPYLDKLGQGYDLEYEQYMLPVLSKFDGLPEVTDKGEFVYRFPELQTIASETENQVITTYLREKPWRFSRSTSGQIILASCLGIFNFVGALVLGNMFATHSVLSQAGGLLTFIQIIYPLLLCYGVGFLLIPLGRYFWIQWRNQKIEARNQMRLDRATILQKADQNLRQKLEEARQFASANIITQENLAYTTEQNLIEQEINQSDKIDREWEKRLNQ